MKKLLTVALMLGTFGFVGAASETNANATVVKPPQIRIELGQRNRRYRDRRRWENRGDRVGYNYGRTIVQTRLVRRRFHTYRETYRIQYFPNGGAQTTLISRVRVN